jgi:hypothetical protein
MNFFDITVSEEDDDYIAELEMLTFRLPLAQAVAIDEWDWHLEELAVGLHPENIHGAVMADDPMLT